MKDADGTVALQFAEPGTNDGAVAIVRVLPDQRAVALCLSLQSDGDIELALPPDVARELSRALADATKSLDRSP